MAPPRAEPKTIEVVVVVTLTPPLPVIVMDCSVAKMLLPATLPIDDCHQAAGAQAGRKHDVRVHML